MFLKIKPLHFLLLVFLTLNITSCSSKKTVSSNKEFVLNAQDKAEAQEGSNILYIVDGREVDTNYIKTLESYKIKSLKVVKDKTEVARYSKKEYDGVILITMKK